MENVNLNFKRSQDHSKCPTCTNNSGEFELIHCSMAVEFSRPEFLFNNSGPQQAQLKDKIHRGACLYNPSAYHLGIRNEVIEWLKGISIKLGFNDITYFHAIYLLDGLLSYFDVPDHLIKLATYLALHLTAKLHENYAKIPNFISVIELFNYEYTMNDLTGFESRFFSAYDYQLNRKTVYSEIQLLLEKGMIFCSDFGILDTSEVIQSKIYVFRSTLQTIICLYPYLYELYKYDATQVALTAISIARKRAGLTKLPFDIKLNKAAFSEISHEIEALLEPLIVDTFVGSFMNNSDFLETKINDKRVKVSICETEIEILSESIGEDMEQEDIYLETYE